MKKIILFLFLIFFIKAGAQNIVADLQKYKHGSSHIIINQDDGISTLLTSRVNEIKKEQKIPGFRINIFYDDGQDSFDKAMQTRAHFVALYNYPCEYIYEAPDSKLNIGNFRTKSEAYAALIKVRPNYPKAFIKPDKIDLPDLEYKYE